jgi:DNA-binding response OmpR family regulator
LKTLVLESNRHRSGLAMDLLRLVPLCDPLAVRNLEEADLYLGLNTPDYMLVAEDQRPIDGFEWTRAYRRNAAHRSNTAHVVLILREVDRAVLTRSINCGADAVLRWPLSQSAVENVIKAIRQFERPFIRTPAYVGPCRRRGMAPGVTQGLRLEGHGDVHKSNDAMTAFERAFVAVRANRTMDEASREALMAPAVEALTAYMFEASLTSGVDLERVMAKSNTLLRAALAGATQGAQLGDITARLRKVSSKEMRAMRNSAGEPGAEVA